MDSTHFNETLERLEQAAAALEKTSPSDLERLERLLADRTAAVSELSRLVRSGYTLAPASARRLEAVMAGGTRLRGRLLLVKAELRHQLGQLFNSGFLLRALAPVPPPSRLRIDCRG